METCICSLPTSTKAASGSRTARLILLVVIRALTFLAASQARWRFWKRQIFPTGKPTRASPKCADIRHQSQSTLRAQGTKAHTATLLTTSHDAHPTKFMAREQVQMVHETTLGLANRKINNPERVESIPHIPLVQFDFAAFQQAPKHRTQKYQAP